MSEEKKIPEENILKGKYNYPEIKDRQKGFVPHFKYVVNRQKKRVVDTKELIPPGWSNEALLETLKIGDEVDLTMWAERHLVCFKLPNGKRFTESEIRDYLTKKQQITKIDEHTEYVKVKAEKKDQGDRDQGYIEVPVYVKRLYIGNFYFDATIYALFQYFTNRTLKKLIDKRRTP